MKKLLSAILAVSLLFSVAACGNESEKQASGPSFSPTEPRERVTLSIGMPYNSKIQSFEDNALTHWVEEQCDVDLEFVIYSGGYDISAEGAKKQMYQPLPDILYGVSINKAWIPEYGRDGVLQDLTPYFEDRDGASKVFWERMDQCLSEEDQTYVLSKITDTDTGKIYGVPTIKTYISKDRPYQPWINQVWLDQLGLEMPQSTNALYETLKAFKEAAPAGDSTIPLFGSEKAGGGASVVDWIINMFIYYNPDRPWQDYNGDGQVELVYTQDAYRDALKFLNRLYRERLLSSMLYLASGNDMQGITTPESGETMCGIFCGDLTSHTAEGNETLYEYAPMPLWGYAVEEDFYCILKSFVTRDCENVDRAFEVLMALWSREGTMRVRYGEYGENWTDADPGAVSALGYPAEYKLIEDPWLVENSAHWGTVSCGLFAYSDGETAQIPTDLDPWFARKGQLEADSQAIFDEAQKNNPENQCPPLSYTVEEQKKTDEINTNINHLVSKRKMAYITGIDGDIHNDDDWNAFLQTLKDAGIAEYTQIVQTAYERQKG